jgi:hypothetical protein
LPCIQQMQRIEVGVLSRFNSSTIFLDDEFVQFLMQYVEVVHAR